MRIRRFTQFQSTRGFTLIELMVTLAVVAVFASLAAPSFRQLIAQQRIKSVTSAITESVWMARSEALKRNGSVGFTFTTAAAGWNVVDGATSAVLLTQDGFPAVGSSVTSGTGVLTFNAYGRLSSGANKIQLFNTAANVVRCVTISSAGYTSVTTVACT